MLSTIGDGLSCVFDASTHRLQITVIRGYCPLLCFLFFVTNSQIPLYHRDGNQPGAGGIRRVFHRAPHHPVRCSMSP